VLYPLIPWPALVLKQRESKTLIIADLHLGFEYELSEIGISIPSQTLKIQSRLLRIIKEVAPSRLILLGDVKHSVSKISIQEWKELPLFFESIQKYVDTIEVVPGNHDGDLAPLTPRSVKILSSHGVLIGNEEQLGLFHGHAWPNPELLGADCLIMAHNHPVIRFDDDFGYRTIRRIWVKARLNLSMLHGLLSSPRESDLRDPDREIDDKNSEKPTEMMKLIIMPAFNEMLGGLQMNGPPSKRLLGPLMRSGAIDIDNAEAYLLDGSYLGTLSHLRRVAKPIRKRSS